MCCWCVADVLVTTAKVLLCHHSSSWSMTRTWSTNLIHELIVAVGVLHQLDAPISSSSSMTNLIHDLDPRTWTISPHIPGCCRAVSLSLSLSLSLYIYIYIFSERFWKVSNLIYLSHQVAIYWRFRISDATGASVRSYVPPRMSSRRGCC